MFPPQDTQPNPLPNMWRTDQETSRFLKYRIFHFWPSENGHLKMTWFSARTGGGVGSHPTYTPWLQACHPMRLITTYSKTPTSLRNKNLQLTSQPNLPIIHGRMKSWRLVSVSDATRALVWLGHTKARTGTSCSTVCFREGHVCGVFQQPSFVKLCGQRGLMMHNLKNLTVNGFSAAFFCRVMWIDRSYDASPGWPEPRRTLRALIRRQVPQQQASLLCLWLFVELSLSVCLSLCL